MTSIIMDLLKDIPLSAVLKEKMLTLDAKIAESETEITLLKGELRDTKIQLEKYQNENKRLTEQINSAKQTTPELDDIAHKILAMCGIQDAEDGIYEYSILDGVTADAMTIKYHIKELQDAGLIKGSGYDWREGASFAITQKGRKYLMEQK